METIYRGMKITSKAYPLRTGEWMREARVLSKTHDGFLERQILDRWSVRFPSERLAEESSIQLGKMFIDLN